MITATATLKSISPYSQSRPHTAPKKDKEAANDYEQRTWRERLHVDREDQVFIPGTAFKNCLSEAAKYLSLQIPGKGKATYTKHFEAGVIVPESLPLGVHKNDVPGEDLYLNADGRRGGSTRVWRTMPIIHEWSGDVQFLVLDPTITEDVFKRVLTEAGQLIGIGRWRPRNNGLYGRFSVEKVNWAERNVEAA